MRVTEAQLMADNGTPAVTRHPGLSDEVYEAILSRLMALKIGPGARITVDNMARELNVSPTPIREALGRLEGEGLVTRTHLVGYRAAPQISRRRFEELYEMRLMLEPACAARAAGRATPEGLAHLREVTAAMFRPEGDDPRLRYSAFARWDAQFHDAVMALAGNELVRHTLAHQHTHFFIFRLMFHSSVTEEALGEHEALLASLAAGDGAGAEQAMRIHIERSRDRLLPAFG
jgi:DNA-binding GntR family transcriptional regulator